LSREKAEETIRAASLVGGSRALDLIETIVEGLGRQVGRDIEEETCRAWQYFDVDEFADRIVAPLKLTSIVVSDLPSVANALGRLTTLEEILVNGYEGVANVSSWKDLPKLDRVGFGGVTPSAIFGLDSCHQIREMEIPSLSGNSLDELKGPPNLRSLDIYQTEISSLAGIEQYRCLVNLRLAACPLLTDVANLTMLPQVRIIEVFDCPKIDMTQIPPEVEVVRRNDEESSGVQG
jgi:hypothetical protein